MIRCPFVNEAGEQCQIDCDGPTGLKQHMSKTHGGYYIKDLKAAGIEPSNKDIARALDNGRKSIAETREGAPDVDTGEEPKGTRGLRQKRQSATERAEAEAAAEFDRLRPLLLRKWKRRLRIPYSLWARLSGDNSIALSDDELNEGAEMHVDFVQAMGWLRAGKIEAIIDIGMWHGGTILARSDLGKNLIKSFMEPAKEPEEEEVK